MTINNTMQKYIYTLLAFALTLTAVAQQMSDSRSSNFDMGWKFSLGDSPKAWQTTFNDASWRSLDVPHDWSIELENNKDVPGGGSIGFFPTGIGWYRKTFDVQKFDAGKNYSIEFDGVYMNSEVWVNDIPLGKYPYGYTSFSYDLTGLLKSNGNVIAVRVDNSAQPNSRWYTGSGIYRHVRLVATNKIHFERGGIFSYTKSLTEHKATMYVKSTVANDNPKVVQDVVIRNSILDSKGNQVASSDSKISLNARSNYTAEMQIAVPSPALWSVDSPSLYTLKSTIFLNGKETDVVFTTVGIRTIEYDPEKGFFLNGKAIKMKGVNLHHDGGAVGAAVPNESGKDAFRF